MSKAKPAVIEEEEVFNPLSSKKILIKYIMKHKNGVTQKDHIAYAGMLDVATRSFSVKKNASTDSYIDPFTKNEKMFVSETMGIDIKRLSPSNIKDCYYNDYFVSIGKAGLTLNMSYVEDFFKLRVLQTNTGLIAPDFASIKSKEGSYQFYIVDQEDEIKIESQNANTTKDAYIGYGKISENRDKLAYIVWAITKQMVSSDTKLDTLQAKMYGLLTEKPQLFNKFFSDKLFEYKTLIYKALICGVITRKSEEYYTDGKLIAIGNMSSNLENTAKFLANPANQTTKFLIEDRIKNTKE